MPRSTPHTNYIRISGGETKYQDFSFFFFFFNNPEFIWMRGKVWEPLSHMLNPATPNICWCTGKNRNKIRCLSALREAAGSYLHFLFSGAVKQIFYLHSVHWKPMRVHFGKLAYFQINFSFLWKKIAHDWGNMAQALKHMLQQMGRGPESRCSPAFLTVLVLSPAREISLNIHEFVLILICSCDLPTSPSKKTQQTKKPNSIEISTFNLLNTGYTKDIRCSKTALVKIVWYIA